MCIRHMAVPVCGRQRTPFSRAEFMAEEPVKPRSRSLEQQRETEPVGAGR